MVARWLIEQRERSVRASASEREAKTQASAEEAVASNGHFVSDNFLADRADHSQVSRSRG